MGGRKIIVVGAGIGGISAAWRLQNAGFEVRVYDRADYVGGRMKTVRKDGFVIDVGAGILPVTYLETMELIRDAGLEGQMERVRGNFAIPRDGRIHYIDLDRMGSGFLRSGVLGWRSKLQLVKPAFRLLKAAKLLDFQDLGPAAGLDSESVADYCRRELSPELLDYLFGPMVRMMYLHPPEESSMVEALWSLKNLMGNAFSIRGGMEALPQALASNLDVRLSHEVLSVEESPAGVRVQARDSQGEVYTDEADRCFLAVDAEALLGMHRAGLTERQADYLAELPYSHDLTVHFCLGREPAIDATLVQVPEAVGGELAALVVDHKKGSGRAPPGKGLVTAHFLSRWGERMIRKADDVIVETAAEAVAAVMPEVRTALERHHVERWTRAATMPRVGDFTRLAGFMQDIDHGSRVRYVGDYMVLSSVNVAVATAKKLSEEWIQAG